MKKLLLSTLVAVMVLSFSSLAFAGAGAIAGPAFTDIAGHDAESDLTLLAALGIFTGDSGVGSTVRPDASITRAEFAKVVVVAANKGSTATGLAGLKPTFKDDIPTWAWGYINCAIYMGVINGYADGTFGPSNNVTYGEAVTMLVKAVSGHNAQVPPGVWPYNYLFYGVDAGFTGGVDVGFANLPATRGDVARMLVAMMGVNKVNKDGEAIADSSYLFPKTTKGVFSTFVLGDNTTITVGGNVLPTAAKVYLSGASNYPGLLGLNVWAVENADEDVVAVVVKQAANQVKGVIAGYLDESTLLPGLDTYELADGTKIPIAFDLVPAITTKVTVNGAAEVVETGAVLSGGEECTFTLGADGKATNVTALRFDLPKTWINSITKSTATVDTAIACYGAANYDVPKTASVSINGGSIGRDSLAKWDVIYLASKNGVGAYDPTLNPIYAIRGARQSFEGTVKTVRTVTLPGGTTEYTTFEFADKSTKEYVTITGGGITPPLTIGTTGKYGLDDKGKVFVQQTYAAGTTWVLCKSYSTGTGGNFVTVDARGGEVQYLADVSFAAFVGTVGQITINPATNHATAFATYAPAGTTYDIVAVDVANGNVTMVASGTTTPAFFIPGAVVYKKDASDGTYTYVPFEQLGLWVSDVAPATIDHFINYAGGTSPLVVYTVP